MNKILNIKHFNEREMKSVMKVILSIMLALLLTVSPGLVFATEGNTVLREDALQDIAENNDESTIDGISNNEASQEKSLDSEDDTIEASAANGEDTEQIKIASQSIETASTSGQDVLLSADPDGTVLLSCDQDNPNIRVSLSASRSLQCAEDITFNFGVEGAESSQYEYRIEFLKLKVDGYFEDERYFSKDYSKESSFHYDFYAPGEYQFKVSAREPNNNNKLGCITVRFNVSKATDSTKDHGHIYVEDAAKQAALYAYNHVDKHTPYNYALIVHNNLISDTKPADVNASTFEEYCGASGALLRHVGTSESYARAMKLILNQSLLGSINSEVVKSDDKAWNLVQINNVWTHIDAAADDVLSGYDGFYSHVYFGVTDDQMKTIRPGFTQISGKKADSRSLNYYDQLKLAISPIDGKYVGLERWRNDVRGLIKEGVAANKSSFSVQINQCKEILAVPEGIKNDPGFYNIVCDNIAYTLATETYTDKNISVLVQFVNNGTSSKFQVCTKRLDLPSAFIEVTGLGSETEKFAYRANGVEPHPTVKVNGTLLTENTNYTLSYSNNKAAGKASVTITGKGTWQGSLTRNFWIAKSVEDNSVKLTYFRTLKNATGHQISPDEVIKDGTYTLKRGTDYTLEYKEKTSGTIMSDRNPTASGTYYVYAKGKGNYSGTKSIGTMQLLEVPAISSSTPVEIASSYNAGFVLDASGAKPAKGANISIWTDNMGSNQQWKLVPDGKGYYYIQSTQNSAYYLDAAGATPSRGSNVSVWTKNDPEALNQKWILDKQADGKYFIRSAANTNLVLDASGASPKLGANVSVWDWNGGANQRWYISDVQEPTFDKNTIYEIRSVSNNNFVLDAAGASPRIGANISLWKDNDGKNQRWYLILSEDKKTYYIRSLYSEKFVLDAAGVAPRLGANVSIWNINYGLNQRWKIQKLADGTFVIRSAQNNSYVLDASGATPRQGANISVWTFNGGNNQRWRLDEV